MPPMPATRAVRAATPIPLSRVPIGIRRVVRAVEGPARAELEREGILPGTVLVVGARTPFGGPIMVDVGRTRLALSSGVAAQVLTDPLPSDPDVADG